MVARYGSHAFAKSKKESNLHLRGYLNLIPLDVQFELSGVMIVDRLFFSKRLLISGVLATSPQSPSAYRWAIRSCSRPDFERVESEPLYLF